MPEQPGLAGVLVGFARALRAEGLAVGSAEAQTYCQAMAALDPADLLDVYWAGRAVLVSRREQIAPYNEVFKRYFLGGTSARTLPPAPRAMAGSVTEAALAVPLTDPTGDGRPEQAQLGMLASDAEVLRHKSFAASTEEERAALRRIMARLTLTPPKRRSRRTHSARAGRAPDLRATVRASLRTGGEPTQLRWRRRKVVLRPIVLILDISGSMADYSRHLLQFAHTTAHAAARVEVFCFGTRLTRVTRALRHRSPDQALADATTMVCDWEGGTKIGACLDEFVRQWARPGRARGAVVVVCSDGFDRGDPETLACAMERLSRLCHRVVWVTPHKSDSHYRPSSVGMMAAWPHIDEIVSGRDLAGLEELAALLPRLA